MTQGLTSVNVTATKGTVSSDATPVNITVTASTGDKLTPEGVHNPSSYANWPAEVNGAVAKYYGYGMGGDAKFQLKSNNDVAGIVSTSTGGLISKVKVTWDSGTANGRTLDIYGYDKPYTAASELYGASAKGTKIGSIVYGTSTQFTYTGDTKYPYVGVRSNSGALYLTDITFEWDPVTSIAVKTAPTTDYEVDDTFNPEGLVLTATYESGKTMDVAYADVEDEFTFSPSLATALTTSNDVVSITYGGQSVNQSITVNAKSCTDPTEALTISSANVATVGTPLTLTTTGGNGGEVVWSVVNGTGTASVSDNTLTPLTPGTVTVTATQAEYNSECGAAPSQEITISAAPATVTLENYTGSAVLTGLHVGDEFTLPTDNSFSCNGKVCVGWSTVEIATPGSKPTSNYFDAGAKVTLDATNTFHAVFATSSSAGNPNDFVLVEEELTDWSGTYLFVDYAANDHAMSSDKNGTTNSFVGVEVSPVEKKITCTNDKLIWILAKGTGDNASKYSVKNKSTETYAVIGASSTAATLSEEAAYLTVDYYSGEITISGGTQSRWFSYRSTSTDFRTYNQSTDPGVYLYKQSGPTYSNYATTCAAETQCVQPTFSPEAGTFNETQSVELSTTTDGATIYYTTNGDTPDDSKTPYTTPISVTQNTTIKAIAIKDGMTNSEVSTGVFKIRFATQPTFSLTEQAEAFDADQTLELSAAGASHIYYTITTDGTTPADPTTESTEYTTTLNLNTNATYKIKAIAIADNYEASLPLMKTYEISKPYADIADFIDNAEGTKKLQLTNAYILGKNGNSIYIQDASTKGIILYNASGYGSAAWVDNLIVGNKITGVVSGTNALFNGQPELASATFVGTPTIEAGTRPTPVGITAINETAFGANTLHLVTISGLYYQSADGKNYTFTADQNGTEASQMVYDQFSLIATHTMVDAEVQCTLTGIMTVYQKNNAGAKTYQLLPVLVSDIHTAATPAEPTFTPAGGADEASAVELSSVTVTAVTNTKVDSETSVTKYITSTTPAQVSVEVTRDFYTPTTVYSGWYKATVALYNINGLDAIEHGTVAATVGGSPATMAEEGQAVTLTVAPDAHYAFTSILVNGVAPTVVTAGEEYTFNMPAEDVTVAVVFTLKTAYTVTWNNNGDESVTTFVDEGDKPVFPSTPVSCDASSTTFIGWSTAPWEGKIANLNEKTYYTTASAMPAVTGNVTYYAVFANMHMESEELTNAEIHENICNTACAYATAKEYSDGDIDYSLNVWTQAADYYWVQMKTGDPSVIQITAPENIAKVKLVITSGSNSSGGIHDITMHTALSNTTTLSLRQTSRTGIVVASATGEEVSENVLTLSIANPADKTLYLTTSAGCRIWGITVYYTDGTTSDYMTTCCVNHTYTINKTNVSLKAGETEAAGTCDGDFYAKYEADANYTLPTTITVTNAGDEGTGWTWEASTGELLILASEVTGDVEVTIEGVPVTPPTPVYTEVRSGLVAGRHYTVCLEKKVTAVKGATFWSLTYKNSENTAAYLVQEEVPFAAGKPYIIQATDDNEGKLEVAYEGDAVGAPVENGALRGTFGDMTASDLNAINVAPNVVYMLFNNELRPIGTDNHLDAHRAYVLYNLLTVPSTSNFAPGKKVKSMPLQKDVATGTDELNASEAPVKVMIDGKFYILRGEKMYDATGKLVK